MTSTTLRPLYLLEKYIIPIVWEAGWASGTIWTDSENLASTKYCQISIKLGFPQQIFGKILKYQIS
jgi:hypothetical protein